MISGEGWLAILVLLGAAALGVRWWIRNARAPAPSFRCLNCPKLATQIRMHWVGHAAWAAALLATLAWGATR